MKHHLIGLAAAITIAAIGPAWAQVSPLGVPQPSATYPGSYQRYPFPDVTPGDAYRDGLINRWQLQQYEGPTPQALQGPSPDGSRSPE